MVVWTQLIALVHSLWFSCGHFFLAGAVKLDSAGKTKFSEGTEDKTTVLLNQPVFTLMKLGAQTGLANFGLSCRAAWKYLKRESQNHRNRRISPSYFSREIAESFVSNHIQKFICTCHSKNTSELLSLHRKRLGVEASKTLLNILSRSVKLSLWWSQKNSVYVQFGSYECHSLSANKKYTQSHNSWTVWVVKSSWSGFRMYMHYIGKMAVTE